MVPLTPFISGDPAPSIQWFYNGEPVSGMNLHVVANNLFIQVGRDSGGVYTCHVNNSAGTVSDDFFVTVNGE